MKLNYEVFCFGDVHGSLAVVQKEYFETYAQALEFELKNQNKYEFGVSITPMNAAAERQMRSA